MLRVAPSKDEAVEEFSGEAIVAWCPNVVLMRAELSILLTAVQRDCVLRDPEPVGKYPQHRYLPPFDGHFVHFFSAG
jgi:hypothetical protein